MSSTAIDLGHHLAFAAHFRERTGGAEATLVPLGDDSDGLVVRWCEPGRPAERLHDRLDRLVRTAHLRDAAETAGAIADCLAGLVEQRGRVRVAVPVGATPGHLAHLRSALSNAGFVLGTDPFVPRPYAVLAYWLSTGADAPQGKTLVLDNDGGRTSAIVVDVSRCKVMAAAQLTTTSDADADLATTALRTLLETSYGSAGHTQPVPWSVLSSSIADVVVAGSGANHPLFRRFIGERFPASTLHEPAGSPREMVVRGLLELDRLIGYRCTWPTLDLVLDGAVIRRAGTWTVGDASATVAPVGTRLGFADMPIIFGGGNGDEQASDALVVPPRAGPFPLMSIHRSGAIEIRGAEASLRLHPDWPTPGMALRSIRVVVEDILDLTIDRSPFTPRGDPPHRATDES